MDALIFDFDGVILDSMEVKDRAFCKVFENDGDKDLLDEFVRYHRENGGISRFVKIRYFYETMLKKTISEEELLAKANLFGEEVLKNLHGKSGLIQDSLEFIQKSFQKIPLHIASGALESELKGIAQELEIASYFKSIHGSPTPKPLLIRQILDENGYKASECFMFGDSINDYDSARVNRVNFMGYNNKELQGVGEGYLESFQEFQLS